MPIICIFADVFGNKLVLNLSVFVGGHLSFAIHKKSKNVRKRLTLLCIWTLCDAAIILSQTNVPATDKIAPVGIRNDNISPFGGSKPKDFEEYLVQLAWKNDPGEDGLDSEVKVRKEEVSLAKKDWTRNLSTAINFNESNFPYFLTNYLGITRWLGKEIDQTKIPSVVTYPLWNIGIGVNIGDLLVRKHKIIIANEKVKIAESDIQLRKLRLKSEVLTRYQAYLESFQVLKIRIQSLDAAEANKTQIASLFSLNKAKFEDYNTANKAFYDASESKIKAETDIKVTRIKLEELIGVKWETIEKIKATYESTTH